MIAIIDYGAGNLASVSRALNAVGARPAVIADPSELAGASGIVLPGVGAFGPAIDCLRAAGFPAALSLAVTAGTPLLGICLGMQLLFETSAETSGSPVQGLGWIPGTVRRFPPGLKVPHIGWNEVIPRASSPLFSGLDRAWFYFVHSFYPIPTDPDTTAAVTDYGIEFTSSVQLGPVFGVQFHPEKSGRVGLRLLANFARMCGEV